MREFKTITIDEIPISIDKIQDIVKRMMENQRETLEYRIITDYSQAMCRMVIETSPSWWYYLIPGKVKKYRVYQDYCRTLLRMVKWDE